MIDLKLKIGRHFPGMPFPAEICVFSLTDSLTSLDDLFPIPETLLSPSVQFYISFVGKFSSSLSQKTCLSFCKAFKNLKFSFETSLEHKKQPKNAFKHKPRKNSPPSFFFGLSRDFNDRLRHSAHYSFSQLEPTVERSPTVTAPPNIILFPYSTLVRLAIFLAVFSGETLFTAENIAICILAMGVYAYASNLLSRCVYWVSPGFYECWGRNISDGLKNRMDRLKESFSFDRLVIGLTNRLSAMGGVWGSEALLFAYGFFASLFPHWSVPQEMQSERE